MNDKTYSGEPIRWYVAREILYFEYADISLQQDYLVWENLVLLNAQSPEQAYQKAIKHGKDSEEEVTIDNHKGFCRFKGLKTLSPVYDDLEDGAEIEWLKYEVEKEQLQALAKDKEDLLVFAE
jgi:Domain of unknown function (DUF4288)